MNMFSFKSLEDVSFMKRFDTRRVRYVIKIWGQGARSESLEAVLINR